jgi:hypothetical protein
VIANGSCYECSDVDLNGKLMILMSTRSADGQCRIDSPADTEVVLINGVTVKRNQAFTI